MKNHIRVMITTTFLKVKGHLIDVVAIVTTKRDQYDFVITSSRHHTEPLKTSQKQQLIIQRTRAIKASNILS